MVIFHISSSPQSFYLYYTSHQQVEHSNNKKHDEDGERKKIRDGVPIERGHDMSCRWWSDLHAEVRTERMHRWKIGDG